MTHLWHKFLALTIATALGGILLLSILAYAPVHSPHGHTVPLTHGDCPFMGHEESICPMNLLEHLSLLEDIFAAGTPSLPTLLLLVGALLLASVIPTKRRLLHKEPERVRWRWLRTRSYTFGRSALQEHFARGILHPKIFPL